MAGSELLFLYSLVYFTSSNRKIIELLSFVAMELSDKTKTYISIDSCCYKGAIASSSTVEDRLDQDDFSEIQCFCFLISQKYIIQSIMGILTHIY